MSSTFSDPYLAFAFLTGLGALGVAYALTLVILVLRLKLVLGKRRWDAFVAKWRPELLEVMMEGRPPALALRGLRDRIMFLRLWAYLHESVLGESQQRLDAAALRLSMDSVARRLLARGTRAQVLQATLAAGHLRDLMAWHDLVRIAHSTDSLLSVHAAQAMLRIDPARGTRELLPMILLRRDWDIGRVAAFLSEAREQFGELLQQVLLKLDDLQLPRALQLAQTLRLALPAPTLAELLDWKRPALVIAAALPLVAEPQLAELVRRAVQHPDARVRERAATQLTHLAGPQDVELVAELMHDKAWPVRIAAARTLARLPYLRDEDLDALATDEAARLLLAQARMERARE